MYGGLAFVAFGGQQNTTCSMGQAAVSRRGVIMKTNLKKNNYFYYDDCRIPGNSREFWYV